MKPIRVLLAEDHALVRAGFRALLENLPGIQVVAEAGDGREALHLIETHRPDVVLMDITMPGLNGLGAAARVANEFPYVHVIILSMHANEEYVLQALRAGAAGYLLKDAGPTELELAVTAVARGETYLSPPVSKHVIADYVRRVGDESSSLVQLTPRQREVLQLIAEGHTTREIARILDVSVKTAETHRAQLMERLDIHDIAGLVRYAIRVGLVSPEK
jgi:DNA-binding NarL/FixJ family response regulator